LKDVRSGRSPVQLLHLIWHVRHAGDIVWIAPLLNAAAEDLPDIDVRVEVYVTRTKAADEPWPGIIESPGVEMPGTQTPGGRSRESETTLVGEEDVRPLLKPHASSPNELTREAQEMITFRPGRADLHTLLEEDVAESTGSVNVTVCGPETLMESARKAVRAVNTPESARRGQVVVDYFEETLGS
jgi:hypothetical protein